MVRTIIVAALAACAALPCGCADGLNRQYLTPERKAHGLVYILPGIQGVDVLCLNIRRGLVQGGVPAAIRIQPWGSEVPAVGMAINQTCTTCAHDWGHKIARSIDAYRHDYPGRPVHIIGHSAGAAVAVFTAEALAETRGAKPIDGIVLLSASLSSDYNLAKTLSMVRDGIVNFYDVNDRAALGVGTAIMGNVDGGHGESAGRVGFSWPRSKVYNVAVTEAMAGTPTPAHFADTTATFAGRYIAPWILRAGWPPPRLAGGRWQ